VYAGTKVDFHCNYTGVVGSSILKWLFNFTILNNNRYQGRQTVTGDGSVGRRLKLLSGYDYGRVQCVLVHQYGYKSTSNGVVMKVQGIARNLWCKFRRSNCEGELSKIREVSSQLYTNHLNASIHREEVANLY